MVLAAAPPATGPRVVEIQPDGGQVGFGVNKSLVVKDVIGGLPAAAGGMRPGMRVLSVNGTPVGDRDAYVLAMKNALRARGRKLSLEVGEAHHEDNAFRSLVAADMKAATPGPRRPSIRSGDRDHDPFVVATFTPSAHTAATPGTAPPAARRKKRGTVSDTRSPKMFEGLTSQVLAARRKSAPLSPVRPAHPLLAGAALPLPSTPRRSSCNSTASTASPPSPRAARAAAACGASPRGASQASQMFFAGNSLHLLSPTSPHGDVSSPFLSPNIATRRGQAVVPARRTSVEDPQLADTASPSGSSAPPSPTQLTSARKKRGSNASGSPPLQPPRPFTPPGLQVVAPSPAVSPKSDGEGAATAPAVEEGKPVAALTVDVDDESLLRVGESCFGDIATPGKWGRRRSRLSVISSDESDSQPRDALASKRNSGSSVCVSEDAEPEHDDAPPQVDKFAISAIARRFGAAFQRTSSRS